MNIKAIKFLFFIINTCAYLNANATIYKIDSKKTNTIFTFENLGFPSPSGQFKNITGKVYLDEKSIEKSKVNIEIPVKTLTTSLSFLDKKLKSSAFFNEEKFPTIYFKSTSISPINEHDIYINGCLTIREISQPIVLNAKMIEIKSNLQRKPKTYIFKAVTYIDRSTFELDNVIPLMANKIKVNITTEIHQNIN